MPPAAGGGGGGGAGAQPPPGSAAHSVVDYSKWDRLGDSSSSSGDEGAEGSDSDSGGCPGCPECRPSMFGLGSGTSGERSSRETASESGLEGGEGSGLGGAEPMDMAAVPIAAAVAPRERAAAEGGAAKKPERLRLAQASPLAPGRPTHSVVDYSKWDRMEDSSSSDGDERMQSCGADAAGPPREVPTTSGGHVPDTRAMLALRWGHVGGRHWEPRKLPGSREGLFNSAVVGDSDDGAALALLVLRSALNPGDGRVAALHKQAAQRLRDSAELKTATAIQERKEFGKVSGTDCDWQAMVAEYFWGIPVNAHVLCDQCIARGVETGCYACFRAKYDMLKRLFTEAKIHPTYLRPERQPRAWSFGMGPHLGVEETRQGVTRTMHPTVLPPGSPFVHVAIGSIHAVGLTAQGEVFTWGKTDRVFGNIVPTPQPVVALDGCCVSAVACGAEHTIAALEGGGLVAWGSNKFGALGTGPKPPSEGDFELPRETTQYAVLDDGSSFVPVPKAVRMMRAVRIRSVCCGAFHSMCLVEGGAVFAWGNNSSGQLGTGDREDRHLPDTIDALWGYPVVQLAAGERHSAVLTTHGRVLTWGRADMGQLGLSRKAESAGVGNLQDTARWRERPKKRRFLLKPSRRLMSSLVKMGISAEQAKRGLIRTQNQSVEAALEWIYSNDSETAGGTGASGSVSKSGGSRTSPPAPQLEDVMTPTEVAGLGKVTFIAAGLHKMFACCTSDPGGGAVYAWGYNDCAALGVCETDKFIHYPRRIDALQGRGVTQIACGVRHTLAMTDQGKVFAWGAGEWGQLGLPSAEYVTREAAHNRVKRYWTTVVNGMEAALTEFRFLEESEKDGRESFPDNPPWTITSPVCVSDTWWRPELYDRGPGFGDPTISAIYAGQFVTVVTKTASTVFRASQSNVWLEKEERLLRKLELLREDSGKADVEPVAALIKDMFSSPECMSALFLVPLHGGERARPSAGLASFGQSPGSHSAAVAPSHAFAFESAKTVYAHILQTLLRVKACRPMVAAMSEAGQAMVRSLHGKRDATIPERVCGLIVLLMNPVIRETAERHSRAGRRDSAVHPGVGSFIVQLARVLRQLPTEGVDSLIGMLKTAPRECLLSMCNFLQTFITAVLSADINNGVARLEQGVEMAVEVLAIVEEASHQGKVVEPEAFYNATISKHFDPADQYAKWMHNRTNQDRGEDQVFSFLHYPFLFDSAAKREILHAEAYFTMAQTVHVSQLADVFGESAAQNMEGLFQNAMPGLTPNTSIAIDQPIVARKGRNYASSRDRTTRRRVGTHPDDFDLRGSSLDRSDSLDIPTPENCGVSATHPEACLFRCRRPHLVSDALAEVARQTRRDLLKPLKVHFIGEQGVDAGGVKKEFFQLFFDEVLSPDYGMFNVDSESRALWFAGDTGEKCGGEQEEAFLLIGVMVGLAVYNQVILNLPFPGLLWHKILGVPTKFSDFTKAFPEQGRSLQKVLEYDECDGKIEDVMCLDFSVDTQGLPGTTRNIELKPGGANICVTKSNRSEYVDLFVDFAVNVACEQQYESFSKGFYLLCGGQALELFRPLELENLVCGSPDLDFDALKRGTKYDGGYNPESQAVLWFWQIVSELDMNDKKQLLNFFTGSDRAPIGGLKNINCIIQRAGPDSMSLPTAHTCFNVLILPDYTSRGKTRDRLLTAINNSSGFGLE